MRLVAGRRGKQRTNPKKNGKLYMKLFNSRSSFFFYSNLNFMNVKKFIVWVIYRLNMFFGGGRVRLVDPSIQLVVCVEVEKKDIHIERE